MSLSAIVVEIVVVGDGHDVCSHNHRDWFLHRAKIWKINLNPKNKSFVFLAM